MIVKLTRILSILTILLLSFCCKSLAATWYVNVNNPTPGAGTSWATAFNNLQSALAVSTTFDRIWVAQGTYKPLLPVGRSATFVIPAGFVLGGFNGTETVETQRNPTLYPTILSGDIGVPGDKTDNCYHVVTVESLTNWPTLDGFTIQDGQADAGYPASSVAVADNTGGGVLVVAHAGEMSFFTMNNCTLTNNFAVYGGGLGGFGDGNQTNFGGTQCMFNGNRAVYGGAMANIASNSDWSLLNFSSCMFINNTAAASNASVVYQSITNNTNSCSIDLQNCLFYNETTPMFTSLTNGQNYHLGVMNCIIWTSGAAYGGGYSTGNSPVAFDNCDVNGPPPTSSSINADPLFVNAAGGDFHVSPCSPVVDAGFPWTFPGSQKDYGGADRFQGTKIDIGPYEQVKGAAATAPTAGSPSYCVGDVAPVLTATGVSGASFLWYNVLTGGTGSTVAPTPSTASAGTTSYYVSQTPSGGCESARTQVKVTVGSPGVAPTAGSPSYCVGDVAPALSATATAGASLLWYPVATGGTGVSVAPVPPTTAAGTIAYYVSQRPATGCESQRREVDVTIKPAPAVEFTWSNACEGEATTISAATSSGALYSWDFGSGASVTGSGAGPYEVKWAGGGSNMVVLKETSGGCQGEVQHLITVNPLPKVGIAPVTTGLCAGNTVPLEAFGATTYQWSPATGLSNSAIADPEVHLQSNIQYTVTGTDDNGCTASAVVVLDINPNCLLYSVPDAFSPNGDGKNDIFRVRTGDDPKSFSLVVFNRLGGKVFESSNVGIGWDGMIGGNSAPTGAYVYVLQATMSTGIVVKRQGSLMLIR